MRLASPLRRAFFERPCREVAGDLLGALLVHRLADGTRLVGRLVELEAYLGDGSDPGSHSHRGPTPRNRSMFGPPGRLYAYRSYGIHCCINVVCEPEGSGAAVLIRALEALEGAERMRDQRQLAAHVKSARLASGPGRLTRALGLELADDGRSLLRGALTLHPGPSPKRPARGPRVGLTRGSDLPYRFYDADSPSVSPWRPGRPSRAQPGTTLATRPRARR